VGPRIAGQAPHACKLLLPSRCFVVSEESGPIALWCRRSLAQLWCRRSLAHCCCLSLCHSSPTFLSPKQLAAELQALRAECDQVQGAALTAEQARTAAATKIQVRRLAGVGSNKGCARTKGAMNAVSLSSCGRFITFLTSTCLLHSPLILCLTPGAAVQGGNPRRCTCRGAGGSIHGCSGSRSGRAAAG
jgi:hypothetical protein